ncbi:hypothetical protein ACFVZ3_19235 [Kitasatospora purpeofusca]|uniref:hypothetical protein n=1 Tax=Kitasatospora purpeofusca TaxID=67352 RepID=UPI0036996229
MSRRITPASLARAADVNRVWASKAIELGLMNPEHLDGDDVIVLRVFAVADQIVWPGDRRSRSEARNMAIWHSVVVSTARDALNDAQFNSTSLLWVTKDGVKVTHTMAEALVLLSDASWSTQCSFHIPIGVWVAELPDGFSLPSRIVTDPAHVQELLL